MSDLTVPTTTHVTEPGASSAGSRFRIVKHLGGGGMGDVYLAQDLRLPRQVAIKTIRQDLCENTEVRKRIERECQLHAKIGIHPHIVALHDLLEENGNISMIMEYKVVVDRVRLCTWRLSRLIPILLALFRQPPTSMPWVLCCISCFPGSCPSAVP